MIRHFSWFVAAVALAGGDVAPVFGQFCGGCFQGPPPTLSQQLEKADAAYRVRCVSRLDYNVEGEISAVALQFQILETLKPGVPNLKRGTVVDLSFPECSQRRGEEFFLLGQSSRYKIKKDEDDASEDESEEIDGVVMQTQVDWTVSPQMTEAAYRYVKDLPSAEVASEQILPGDRLRYFIRHLEHTDETIAEDAFRECDQASSEDLAQVAESLPREKLKSWLHSGDLSESRRGRYGLMLGLCGDAGDAALLEQIILRETEDDFRFAIDGVMEGYLLLTGETGLDVLDEAKLKNENANFSEVYAAMNAVRFMARHSQQIIKPERLRASMRLLLDRPELADLAVVDLARMEDWDLQDRLMAMYDDPDYDAPSIKRAIIRYMLVSAKFKPMTPEQSEPEHVVKGKKYLAELEERDPKTVKDAKRFWVVK